MQPTLQISIEVLYVREPSRTSGARYHNVTTLFMSDFARGQGSTPSPETIHAHLVTERVDGDTERSRQTEITDLELSSPVDQQVLGLQVSVQYSVVMAECHPLLA